MWPKNRDFNMSTFSQTRAFHTTSVITAAYPPLVRNISIKSGVSGVAAGHVVIVKTTGAELWDGSTVGRLAIATESQRDSASSLPCLVIGSYKSNLVNVGGAAINESQKLTLMSSSLFSE